MRIDPRFTYFFGQTRAICVWPYRLGCARCTLENVDTRYAGDAWTWEVLEV